MEQVFFSADLHLDHSRILTVGNGRPFDTLDEMNERIIDNWNSLIGKNDRVYFLGDFAFAKHDRIEQFLDRITGQVHYVRGNHDKSMQPFAERFVTFGDYKSIKVGGQQIVLSHFPFLEWDRCHKGSWHIHGHQHGNGHPTNVPRLDVGVDCFNFAPVNFDEIAAIMSNREWEPQSHH